LKPEQWESPLVQEKYQEEKARDKRHPYRIIIIIIIIIISMFIPVSFLLSKRYIWTKSTDMNICQNQ